MSALGKEGEAKHGGDVGVVRVVWSQAMHVLLQSVWVNASCVCGSGSGVSGVFDKD